ncbi:MAG: 30S ribosomal protein S4 [Candidatus Liberibacter europaeus]|uniref:Small ribosomal subunit protein uS4 n=1 Tax=Candidatus Liberibacter europaeus TaxID=744859 RepID=A0A2T4VWJ1_9HYPH|nr:30S ribosomal protein S4 [Candidatus Liberibacter europaeus]PTL86154.1 MAG: 30S ribosomal protein S4 [Candidatus Liberibacter europaeus]
MSKRESSKYKIDRRLGENLWGRPKSPVNVRAYGPGLHGQRRKSKPSYFGLQLRAKQKLKKYYGDVGEKQFFAIFKKADSAKGDTSQNLISFLESRLDTIVYRSKIVPTFHAARQFINHRHILVNGSSVNIGSYRCKAGDVIEVKQKSKQLVCVLESVKLAERDVPDYIKADHDNMVATFIRVPTSLSDVPYPVVMEPNLVVEFYSR